MGGEGVFCWSERDGGQSGARCGHWDDGPWEAMHGASGSVFGVALLVLLAAALLVVVVLLARRSGVTGSPPTDDSAAESVLRRRYAAGDLDDAEFEHRLARLRQP